MLKRILITVNILILSISILVAADVNTVKDGAWDDPSVWNTGTVPVNGDNITISHNITVNNTYNYSSSSITIAWQGGLTIQDNATLYVSSFSSNNGGNDGNYIYGVLYVYNDVNQGNGKTYIKEGGKFYTAGEYKLSGGSGSNLFVDGILEIGSLENTSDAKIIISQTGKIIIHGDYTNDGGAEITINGGYMEIEGSYVNNGDGTIVINDGGTLYIHNNLTNTGGSHITVNDGNVTIDGNVSNEGGSDFSIADGSYVEVNGGFSNTGGGVVTIDGSLDVDGEIFNDCGSHINGSGSLAAGSVSDCNSNPGIDPALLVPKVFYAIASGNWLDKNIWSNTDNGTPCNSTPPVNSIVIIDTGYTVNLNNKIKLNKLYICDNSKLTLLSQANLITSDSLKLYGTIEFDNSVDSSANYINEGKIVYGPNAQIIDKIPLTGGAYHYISSFIPDVPTSVFQGFTAYQYDETAPDNWLDNDPSNDYLGWKNVNDYMSPTDGYAVYSSTNKTLVLTGDRFNTGTYTTKVTKTDNFSSDYSQCDGWNLIGNPYPSSIDAVKFLNDNKDITTGNAYIWIDDHSNGKDYSESDYMQINLAGTITPSDNDDGKGTNTTYIAPNQAFFVQATGDGTVEFNNAQRVEYVSKLKSQKIEELPPVYNFKIAVKQSSTKNYNETLIAFSPAGSDKFDPGYDGRKRMGNYELSIYSFLDGQKMGIQTFTDNFDRKYIPLGVTIKNSGYVTFTFKNIKCPETYLVFLLDKKNNDLINIKSTDYTTYIDAGTYNDRFELLVKKSFVFNYKSSQDETFKIYNSNNLLVIKNLTEDDFIYSKIKITSLSGETIYQDIDNISAHSTIQLPVNLETGVYVVSIYTNNKLFSQKIFVQ